MRNTVQASFKYMLYNHHERKFKLKHADETRLFRPRSLYNLDQVIIDIEEAIKSCVRLPQASFVVYYKGNQDASADIEGF